VSPPSRFVRRTVWISPFDDGAIRDVDLGEDMWGAMFEPLRDPTVFAQASIDHGTVGWPNGLDLDPLVLHGDFEPTAPRPPSST
jgi:hypothetical protein